MPGPITDLALTRGAIYVASLPLESPGVPRLTRFDAEERSDADAAAAREVLDGTDQPSQFRLASDGADVFVTSVTGRDVTAPMILRVGGERVEAAVRLDALAPVTHVVGRAYVAGDELLVPVLLAGERSAIVILARDDLSLICLYHLDHAVSEIVAADCRTIACIDSLATAGREGLHLSFVERSDGKEVARIRVTNVL